MVQTMYKLCVCVFYLTCVNATRLLFLLPKIITPFQGNSYRLIITVTVALQQLDFASYLCLRVCVSESLGHKSSSSYSSSSCRFLVLGQYISSHFFFFDFESKCKPRVSYHRDHPLDFTSIMCVCFVIKRFVLFVCEIANFFLSIKNKLH